ncbi:DNA binding domain-containing protein, excisionase family [Caloramator quimbayensis]|uniref:DNA binding domain-containing protein, excisionase family n=1 Tax=Caloramator quimbayensis TaxID=1147123 RepID=A0A1T4XPP6_9CLOT|nr:DNA binding domain-containing protein, excisionase family [Caloramator quimbayensis]
MEIKIDEKQIAESIINELKRHNLLGEKQQNVTVVYNAESQDILYTVSEVAELIKCNTNYVYQLIKTGLLPGLKLGSMKVRRIALLEFLEKYQGYDLTDPSNIKPIEQNTIDSLA